MEKYISFLQEIEQDNWGQITLLFGIGNIFHVLR